VISTLLRRSNVILRWTAGRETRLSKPKSASRMVSNKSIWSPGLYHLKSQTPASGDISQDSLNTISIFQVLLPFLTGNLTDYLDEPGTNNMDIAMLSTGLPGSAELKGFMKPDASQLAVARGRNLSAMLRELSHNVSRSLLSNSSLA
jgi:hypothetical protein